MPLILIFTVHAKLQFTYVNTYPEDPPLIEVPSYEGMDDSEAESLREFLDQEVITCDWLSNKTWSIFWKSFIISMFQGCLSFLEEDLKFQLENQIDCFIPFGKLQKTWPVICSVDCKQSLFFFRFSKGSVRAHKRWASSEKQGRQPEKTLTLCAA